MRGRDDLCVLVRGVKKWSLGQKRKPPSHVYFCIFVFFLLIDIHRGDCSFSESLLHRSTRMLFFIAILLKKEPPFHLPFFAPSGLSSLCAKVNVFGLVYSGSLHYTDAAHGEFRHGIRVAWAERENERKANC